MPQTNMTGDNTPTVIETTTRDGKQTNTLKDIEQTLGVVPSFFKTLPATHLEEEWKMFRDFQISDDTALTPKVKQLIGLAVASALRCRYGTYFHTVTGSSQGVTPQEINEALLMARQTVGFSTYLHGLRYDEDTLRAEMKRMSDRLSGQTPQRVRG